MMGKHKLLSALGPGILFASTCIGVSHLVQSTRAGAVYGFELVWIILLANLFKYPFFEYASRYANATETSIIDGYNRLSKWILYLYGAITIGTMFFVTSAVFVVTAGFMDNLLGFETIFKAIGLSYNNYTPVLILFLVCLAILYTGKYMILDNLMKIIGSVLLISTVIAFTKSIMLGGVTQVENFVPPNLSDFSSEEGQNHFAFIIALMGWMPTAMDLSSWNSLWTVAQIKEKRVKPSLKATLFGFNFGYIISAFLAICFVTLGANLFYGSGNELAQSSVGFAGQVVEMFTNAMGPWSKWLIGIASFSVMFGTAIAVLDGYARSSSRIIEIAFYENKKLDANHRKNDYLKSIIGLSIISLLLIIILTGSNGFTFIIDLATTISFIVAPIVAILNFKLVQAKYVGSENTPPFWMKILSYLGIVFLTGFALVYIFPDLLPL